MHHNTNTHHCGLSIATVSHPSPKGSNLLSIVAMVTVTMTSFCHMTLFP